MKKENTSASNPPELYLNGGPLSIVGIGYSPQLMSSVLHFFSHIPANSGIAFVLIPYITSTSSISSIEPENSIKEAELFKTVQDGTPIKVVHPRRMTKMRPNRIYMLVPGQEARVNKGALWLRKVRNSGSNISSIDKLLVSLAEISINQVFGVILSGSVHFEGYVGAAAIHQIGGIVMLEEPELADRLRTPSRSLDATLVDYTLTPQNLGKQLLTITSLMSKKTEAKINLADHINLLDQCDVDELDKIFTLLQDHTGHDFSNYKPNTILRRIDQRIIAKQLQGLASYVHHLETNGQELDTLFKDLLIGVTRFFRDAEAFEALKSHVFPMLLENRDQEDTIRIWVPGCSTGEEAFSIAILLQEFIEEQGVHAKFQIFASDINGSSIDFARRSQYPKAISEFITPGRLKRYFIENDSGYVIKKLIRDKVIFAIHSVINDPPFSRIDLISNRNLLIYFNESLQKNVFPLFHFALNPSGYLFLGNSESVGEFTDLFSQVNRKWKIYKKQKILRWIRPLLLMPPTIIAQSKRIPLMGPKLLLESTLDVKDIAQKILLESYTPPSVVIDHAGTIIYVQGLISPYLNHQTGVANLNILSMIDQNIKLEFMTGLHRISQQEQKVVVKNLTVGTGQNVQSLNLVLQRIDHEDYDQPMIMVIFEALGILPSFRREHEENIAIIKIEGDGDKASLLQELQLMQEYVKNLTEVMDATNEELQSANEEMQSANEEMQSTNEEIETSREELEAVNEELVAVNSEHQETIESLNGSVSDINNLINCSGIATIFLDSEFRIRLFTPTATDVINLIKTDQGRLLSDIVSNLEYPNLIDDAATVLETLIPKEEEVRTKNDEWFLVRIFPYRTIDNVIDGVVLSFVDVTSLHKQQVETKRRNDGFRFVAQMTSDFIYILNVKAGKVIFLSGDEFLGYHKNELKNPGSIMNSLHPDDVSKVKSFWARGAIESQLNKEERHIEYRMQTRSGEWKWIRQTQRPLACDADGQPLETIVMLRIISNG